LQLSLFPEEHVEPEKVCPDRECKGCKKVKPETDFNILIYRRSGNTSFHPCCRECNKQAEKIKAEWREANPLPDNYSCQICGMTHENFKENGRYLNRTPFSVDHCHTTMKVRGWICNRCNTALGLACDDTDVLKKMIKYLDA
jgi:hypothetical protein